jgi:hypothetical protein
MNIHTHIQPNTLQKRFRFYNEEGSITPVNNTIKMNTNIILFNHSFGGLSPPNTAQG